MRWWWRTIQTAARLAAASLFQVRVYGARNVPRTGGVILAVNHQSFLDPILVTLAVDREVHFMARSTLFRNPVFRALIVTLNTFPIQRDSRDVKGVKTAVARLEAGHALVMFPEGTRTRDGTIAPVKPGIRWIAERAAVPIVPVLVEGAFHSWPRTRLLPEPARINLLFGPPLVRRPGEGFGVCLARALRDLHRSNHRRTQRSL